MNEFDGDSPYFLSSEMQFLEDEFTGLDSFSFDDRYSSQEVMTEMPPPNLYCTLPGIQLFQAIAQMQIQHVVEFPVFAKIAAPFCWNMMRGEYEQAKLTGLECTWYEFLLTKKAWVHALWVDQYRKYLYMFIAPDETKKNKCPKGQGKQGRLMNPNEHDDYDLTNSETYQILGRLKQCERDKMIRKIFNLCKEVEKNDGCVLEEPVPRIRETYARRKEPFYWWMDANWRLEWFQALVMQVLAEIDSS